MPVAALFRKWPGAPWWAVGLLTVLGLGLIVGPLRGTAEDAPDDGPAVIGKSGNFAGSISLQPVTPAPYAGGRAAPGAAPLPVPVLPAEAAPDLSFPPVESQQPRVRVVDFLVPAPEAEALVAAIPGVTVVDSYAVGEVPVAGTVLQVAAVDPQTFRVFTPQITADHAPLWERVAAGDIAVSHELGQSDAFPLGEVVPVADGTNAVRVGAFASNGTPPVADAIVSLGRGQDLGLADRPALLIALDPAVSPDLVAEEVQAVLGGVASVIQDPRLMFERVRLSGPITPQNVWDHLAACESGLDWHINTGNGYFGGLQFLPESWFLVGGVGLPHEASREEQIYRAGLLWQRQGWEAWPQCARRLGLIIDPAPTAPEPLPPPSG